MNTHRMSQLHSRNPPLQHARRGGRSRTRKIAYIVHVAIETGIWRNMYMKSCVKPSLKMQDRLESPKTTALKDE